ncbi:hypothetical protein MPSEU_000999000 [Mayamaea pseudoterrestris]|nr:hypothetical protein MPSEU_000999000 [Mayamaea pseudoterrestris]
MRITSAIAFGMLNLLPFASALIAGPRFSTCGHASKTFLAAKASNDNLHAQDHNDAFNIPHRRNLIKGACLALGLTVSLPRSSCAADDRLFRANPLTNSVLEQFRIWNQAEADQVKYGGELERGDAKLSSAEQYAKLLVPILFMVDDMQKIDALVHKEEPQLSEAQRILLQPKYEKIQMKKVFNSFADNIYFSDPDRANVYLAGGAVPNSSQSLAYLLRNDFLTAVEAMQAEIDYLIAHSEESKDDLYKYSQQAVNAMQQYLKIVPPTEIEKARQLIVSQT